MNEVMIICLLILCIGEAVLLYFCKKNRVPKQEPITTEIVPNFVIEAFKNNNYTFSDLSVEDLEDEVRMFKFQIQKEEYLNAENRVIKRFEILLNELWRLQNTDNNITAGNLLFLLKKELELTYEENDFILYNEKTKENYYCHSNYDLGSKVKIYKSAWFYKKNIIIKGVIK